MDKYPQRKNLRLKNYDYSQQGMYFVTVCAQDRECLFGEIVENKRQLNKYGKIVQDVWVQLPGQFENIELDYYVIMPNHFHGILVIDGPKTKLGEFIRHFKAKCTKFIHEHDKYFRWQRNYHDHIIRNEADLNRIREYIINNPLQWHLDVENLGRDKSRPYEI